MTPVQVAELWSLQKEMERLANEYGFSNTRTVIVSEQIDQYVLAEQRQLPEKLKNI
jgi:hypothetical protein